MRCVNCSPGEEAGTITITTPGPWPPPPGPQRPSPIPSSPRLHYPCVTNPPLPHHPILRPGRKIPGSGTMPCLLRSNPRFELAWPPGSNLLVRSKPRFGVAKMRGCKVRGQAYAGTRAHAHARSLKRAYVQILSPVTKNGNPAKSLRKPPFRYVKIAPFARCVMALNSKTHLLPSSCVTWHKSRKMPPHKSRRPERGANRPSPGPERTSV